MADIKELDGHWRITFAADKPLPPGYYEMTRADLVLRDGRMAGVDLGGCFFTGMLSFDAAGQVAVDALLDPRPARPDVMMMQPDGALTKDPTSRKATLKVRRGGDTLSMDGTSSLAGYTWEIHAIRIAELKAP